jgi:hypothetical protein
VQVVEVVEQEVVRQILQVKEQELPSLLHHQAETI